MKSRIPIALAAGGLLLLAACGGQPSTETGETASESAQDAPAQTGPVSVAALSSDTAEAVRALAGVDRLVAVPTSTTNEHLGNHVTEMEQVPHQVPSNSELDPEQVLSWSPDLVVVTSRHDGEQDAGELLAQTDVELLTIDNNWGTVDQMRENYREIAEALDETDRADELIAELDADLAEVSTQLGEVTESPSVLVLTNQAATPFIAGPDSMTTDVVRHAGGAPVVEEAGIARTMPADPEQIVRLEPDAILLVDVLGKGEGSFDEILGNAAVGELAAVENERILLVPGRSAMAAAGMHVADGVRAVAAWLHPEHAQETGAAS